MLLHPLYTFTIIGEYDGSEVTYLRRKERFYVKSNATSELSPIHFKSPSELLHAFLSQKFEVAVRMELMELKFVPVVAE